MGYASQLARSYSNPESTWNSLGSLGSTSAWDQSSPVAQTALYRLKNSRRRGDITEAQDIAGQARELVNALTESGYARKLSELRPRRPSVNDLSLSNLLGYSGDNFLNTANQAGDIFTKQALAGRYMGNFSFNNLF